MRTDASRNRDRILDAARQTYAAGDVDATVRAIARRAGVGVATVYRHFPTRDALVAAAFSRQVTACNTLIDQALADPDPWRGLCTLVEESTRTPGDRAFTVAFLTQFPDAVWASDARAEVYRNVHELIRRAQESGDLRPDFTPGDLALLIKASDSLATTSAAAARRLVAYLMQSFSARTAPLPDSAPIPVMGGSFS